MTMITMLSLSAAFVMGTNLATQNTTQEVLSFDDIVYEEGPRPCSL